VEGAGVSARHNREGRDALKEAGILDVIPLTYLL
jgi:hypothetical protein